MKKCTNKINFEQSILFMFCFGKYSSINVCRLYFLPGDRIWVPNHTILITSQINHQYIHRLLYSIHMVRQSGVDVFVVYIDQLGFGSSDDPDDIDPSGIITIPGFSLLVNNTQILARAVCSAGMNIVIIFTCYLYNIKLYNSFKLWAFPKG